MLTPWLEVPGAPARVQWLSEVTGLDLARLGTSASAEEIRDTAVTQPLIVALGLIAAAELSLDDVAVTAGHSVGELTAAALAGVLTPESAAALAALRGREMAAACGLADTGMSAVLGGDPAEVIARIEECGLVAANRNGAGQVVAAGTLEGLAALAETPPARARVVPLPVAGAFHTDFMAPAEAALADVADGIPVAGPERMLLSNADGTAVSSGREMMKRLVRQVRSPVRWDLCQATLRDLGVTAAIELPPAGTLTGLAKRELPGVEVVALKTPDDLPAARRLILQAAPSGQAVHTPDWRVVVSPAGGTFHPTALEEGTALPAGSPLGVIRTRRDEQHVSATYDGVLVEWLAQDADLVDAGEPLALLYPDPTLDVSTTGKDGAR
jgi:[acyl-carrier-protein] S-malonyltransferase